MVASDFGAGGFGEMEKLVWSDLWDGGQGRGVGCERVRGSRMRSLVQGRFDAGGKNRGIGKKVADVFWKQSRQEGGVTGVVDLV